MIKPDSKSIQEATERVKQKLPIEKVREMKKYRDITPEQYEKLIKDVETYALIILETYYSEPETCPTTQLQ